MFLAGQGQLEAVHRSGGCWRRAVAIFEVERPGARSLLPHVAVRCSCVCPAGLRSLWTTKPTPKYTLPPCARMYARNTSNAHQFQRRSGHASWPRALNRIFQTLMTHASLSRKSSFGAELSGRAATDTSTSPFRRDPIQYVSISSSSSLNVCRGILTMVAEPSCPGSTGSGGTVRYARGRYELYRFVDEDASGWISGV